MRSRRLAAALALGLIASGCGGRSQRDLEQTRRTLHSWNNSLEFAAQQRRDRRVPAMFLPQLLKVANEALRREQRKIDDAAPAQRGEFDRLAQRLESQIRQQQTQLATKATK